MEDISISLNVLNSYNLKFEEYFILYCLHYKYYNQLIDYTSVRKIDKVIFENLVRNEYLQELESYSSIIIDNLKLTPKSKDLFKKREDLWKIFKKKFPNKMGNRRLHIDLPRAEKLYYKIINNNIEDIHDKLILALEICVREHIIAGKQAFMQNIATWLHQETYKAYEDDLNTFNDENLDLG